MKVPICLLVAHFFFKTEGTTNLLLNKPSIQSSVAYALGPERANDGDPSTFCATQDPQSYWQADLQGYYLVKSVAVTPHEETNNPTHFAFIGVSIHNESSSQEGGVVVCGRFALKVNETLIFTCNSTARYVRVWGEDSAVLNIIEVEAHGTPMHRLKGMTMNALMSQKVTMATESLNVGTSTACAKSCFQNQPCLIFSFKKSATPDCLLATNLTMGEESNWVTYDIDDIQSSCP